MFTTEQIDRLLNQGANVLSEDGEKIGSIGQVFVDNEDGQPSWVTVRTGLFGMSESFVPLEGARTEGNDIVVPYSKDHVKDAPRIDADRPLEPAEEDRLYQHYQLDTGRTYPEATTDTASSGPGPERTGAAAEQRDTAPDRTAAPAEAGTPGDDTSAPTVQRDTVPDRTAAPAAAAPTQQRETAAPDRTGAPVAAGTAGYDTTAANEQRDTAPDRSAATGTSGYNTAAPDRTQAPAAAGYDTSTATEQRDTAAPDRTAAPTVAATAAASGAGGTTAQRDTAAEDRAQAPTAAGAGTTAQRDTERRDTGAAAATGRGRLRKYVTTEEVTKTVPVQREEVRIEREPITEENRDEASNRPDKDDEHDVILHEERIIVTKETVPVERVHIGTETVTENVTIKEKVRKEHIDTDGPEEGRG